jgi:hypothetical protein
MENGYLIMMKQTIKDLTICAFCPNTCRPSYQTAGPQIETQTPSALSLITLAVLQGRLKLDVQTLEALARRGAVNASVNHCTYSLNMPKVLDVALQNLQS